MNDLLMTSATIVMTLATVALATFAWQSNKLSKEIKRANDLKEAEDKGFKQQVSDLYQAIVISTLISGPSSYGAFGSAKDLFKSQYGGKTPVFKE
jgi:hypothetical protein